MKPTIFVCEFITAGGFLGQALPESLIHEGLLMRDALIEDILPFANVVTTHDHRLPAAISCHSIELEAEALVWQQWEQRIRTADYVWIIAPETDEILYQLTALALQQKKIVIGAGLDAIAITSEKQKTYNHLSQFNIPMVPTQPYSTATFDDGLWVLKPSDGVGSEDVFIGNHEQLLNAIKVHDLDTIKLIVQPYLNEIAASISVVSYAKTFTVLSYNLQKIEKEQGKLYYKGGELNGALKHQSAMDALVAQILRAIPSLQGYWGVDVMINPSTHQLTVLEINPRLTTSYIKSKQATGLNPAKLIFNMLTEAELPQAELQYNPVSFYV